MLRSRLVALMLLLPGLAVVSAQDIRLLQIKTIYILPNGDAKETKQLQERLPKEIGWQVTHEKSKADAILVYSMNQESAGTYVYSAGTTVTGIPIQHYFKSVQVVTNSEKPELLWQHSKDHWVKISGQAIARLKADLAALRRLEATP